MKIFFYFVIFLSIFIDFIIESLNAVMTIAKASYDLSNIHFESALFKQDGIPKRIEIRYRDRSTTPLFLSKKAPTNSRSIGKRALQDINGTTRVVNMRSLRLFQGRDQKQDRIYDRCLRS